MSALRPVLAAAALVLLAAVPARAADDVPRQMTFQGRLVRADGAPESTAQDLSFALYATAKTAARSDHTHAKPTLACSYRQATGNDAGDAQGAIAWCATGELLTGGGCSGVDGSTGDSGASFMPVGITLTDGSTNSGGPGYQCRGHKTSTTPTTAYAICCRVP